MTGNIFFLESEGGRPEKDKSLFHVLPVPYEKTVSYGTGTSNGPAAIIAASQQLEAFDGISLPLEDGIYTHKAVDCSGTDIQILQEIERRTASILSMGKVPVILGGEHTVSYGPIMAAKNHFGTIGVVHFDAHADLRNEFEESAFSHACVMRRVHEKDIPIVQIGIRSFSVEEQKYRDEHSDIICYDASYIYRENCFSIDFPEDFPDDIYISVDVDGLDPSVIPHTGTPVPGGLFWYDFFKFIETIPASKRIIGFDVVELAPVSGSYVSDFAAAQLTYNIMGIIGRRIK